LRLKSIDIQGFKSFPDRTLLEFNQGVTAVIGPNGAGKSNIADAMRWVLGEQSTKTLRGGRMEDVIFGGTQTRKAQGVASVTLNIDNADRSLRCDADEVAVTRRLYRSGDSEYRINGAQVRLRDLNELFMDTGLGRDGYSIIGQGRVAEIVSARSHERREIFEEAAGISKFRYRKTEAERRLALAEDNLLRLRDILAELEGRVGPLKAQSEKAKRFLEYAGEKKTLEISLWVRSLNQLHTRIAEWEDKLLLAQSDHAAADAAVRQCEADFNAALEEGRACMAAIERARAEAAALRDAAAQTESAEAVEKNNIEHYTASIREIEEALALASDSRGELERSATDAEARRAQLEAAQGEAASAIEAKRGEIEAQAARHAALSAEGDTLRLRRTAAFEAIDAARLDAATSATILGESEERLGAMGENESQLAQTLEGARREIADCEDLLASIAAQRTALDNSAGGYLLKRQSRQQKLDAIEEQRAAFGREIETKRQRARALSDLEKNLEGFGQSVRYIMAQSQRGALGGIHGPVSSLVRVEGEYATAVETALGSAVQNIVVENEDAAKRAIHLLKQNKAGRATFLPLTSVRANPLDPGSAETLYGYVGLASDLVACDAKYAEVIRFLLGRTVVAQDLDAAVVIAKKHNYRFRVVTLDGQVVNAGGSMTGGSAARAAGIIGRRREIEQLLAEAAAAETRRAALDGQADTLSQEIAALDAEVEALEAQRRTLSEDRVRAETQRAALQQELVRAQEAVSQAAGEREALAARIKEMRERSATSEELSKTLSAQLHDLQRQIAENSDAVAAAQQVLAGLQAQLGEQNAARTLLERDLEQTAQEIERLCAARAAGEEQTAAQRARIEALREQIAASERQIGDLRGQHERAQAETRALEEEIGRQNARHSECERRSAELRAAEREAGAKREVLYREVVRLSEQKTSAENEQNNLIARLYDEYELTRSAAEEIAAPVEDVPAANRRLSELRGKIKALGSVNVDAIEEYREVSARYEELSRQLSDVERSKAQLTRLITELTGEMREIFTEKFAEIDRNFRATFTELFEGGSASLSLSDPEDVLESGIEITVHPPGKLIKNLASLSGGEQAFVAIAIFFAILRVNPAPFCLMDEVESALDDVNVARFASYLRRLTDRTQFIAITHRRGTMEEADDLYGVTMQEEGVSRLLRLQVSEIEKTLGSRAQKQEG